MALHLTGRRRIVEESTELYTCSRTARDSEIPPEWDPDGAGGSGGGTSGKKTNITVPQSYNELATLMSVTGALRARAAAAAVAYVRTVLDACVHLCIPGACLGALCICWLRRCPHLPPLPVLHSCPCPRGGCRAAGEDAIRHP